MRQPYTGVWVFIAPLDCLKIPAQEFHLDRDSAKEHILIYNLEGQYWADFQNTHIFYKLIFNNELGFDWMIHESQNSIFLF